MLRSRLLQQSPSPPQHHSLVLFSHLLSTFTQASLALELLPREFGKLAPSPGLRDQVLTGGLEWEWGNSLETIAFTDSPRNTDKIVSKYKPPTSQPLHSRFPRPKPSSSQHLPLTTGSSVPLLWPPLLAVVSLSSGLHYWQ